MEMYVYHRQLMFPYTLFGRGVRYKLSQLSRFKACEISCDVFTYSHVGFRKPANVAKADPAEAKNVDGRH